MTRRVVTRRVVVADDDLLVRAGVVAVLATLEGIEVVAEAASLPELEAAVEETSPDVVVTDIRMPPTLTDEGYEQLVARSDDHDRYGETFVGAARWLLDARICSENDLRESGGWTKSRTHRGLPVYFANCGGKSLEYRVYFNVVTQEFYGRARGFGEAVRLAG